MTVSIIGLGYIGLPTAAIIAKQGIQVYGFDVNDEIVASINKGEVHILEPGLPDLVKDVVNSGKLRASNELKQTDVYLIVVPTPFKENKHPDTSYVEEATNSITPLLKEDDLVIIESTSPVLTTERMSNLISSLRPELKNKIYIAYCPERVLPGNALEEMIRNDRVIGGINDKSTTKAIQFYSQFTTGKLHPTNARTAEMCKLVENASRDSQIAFANELSMICDKAKINVWELIKLANKHPRVNILQPGCGVGGHCIAVDPWFLVAEYSEESKMIKQARLTNDSKADWSVSKILEEANRYEMENNTTPVIACMGLAFKANIDDLRESPAKAISTQIIAASKGKVLIVEPNIKTHFSFNLTNYQDAYDQADIVAWLVGHKEFSGIKKSPNKVELDFCGIRAEK